MTRKQIDELMSGPAKPVETPNNQGVTPPEVGQGGSQPRPVCTGTGGAILEHSMTTEQRQCVALEIELLVLR